MARKSRTPGFEEIVEGLRTRSFDVTPAKGIADGKLVAKGGVAAVLVRGEIARLVDRGYQKFIKTAQYELPATSEQLHAIHDFTEELNLVTGAMGLYNESLGTTSDLYEYDRVRGREEGDSPAPRPWELTGGH